MKKSYDFQRLPCSDGKSFLGKIFPCQISLCIPVQHTLNSRHTIKWFPEYGAISSVYLLAFVLISYLGPVKKQGIRCSRDREGDGVTRFASGAVRSVWGLPQDVLGWQPEQQDPTLLRNNLSLLQGSRSHCAASSSSPYQLLETAARGSPKAMILDQKTPDPHHPLARAVQTLIHAGSPQGTLTVG